MFPFCVWCLEDHFPSISKVIAFVLFTKVPRQFARKQRYRIEQLGLFVNNFVEWPVASAWTLPEFNQIFLDYKRRKDEVL